jgi:hypothetical protein
LVYTENTHTQIPDSSNHPKNDKMVAFKYTLNTAQKIPISNEEKTKAIETIKTIAQNNGYNMGIIMKTYNKNT